MAVDNLDKAIISIAESDGGVGAVIGDRIYINSVPQKVDSGGNLVNTPLPYCRVVMLEREESPISGAGTVDRYTYVFDVFADKLSDAQAGTEAIMAAFQDYSGTVGTVKIQEVWVGTQTMVHLEDPDLHGIATEIFFRIIN